MRKYAHGLPRSSNPPSLHSLLISPCRKVFIAEITARAFIVADSNKRRTLSRADIAKALGKSDQFDFLIDIVPRDEPFVPGVSGPGKNAGKKPVPGTVSVRREVRDVATALLYKFLLQIDTSLRSTPPKEGGTRYTG